MALTDDVIALVHDFSNDGLAVTLIGTPVKRLKERSKSTENCTVRSTSRHVIDEKPDVYSDNESKKKKYSSMCGEVCQNRDSEVIHKKLSKKLDVRYLNQIKSFKDRIKSSYVLSCNQQQCPMIQERLTHHQLIHHLNTKKIDYSNSAPKKIRDKGVSLQWEINVSPTLSRMRLPKFILPFSHDGRLVQTEITMRDFSPQRYTRKQMDRVVNFDKEISLKRSQTRDVLSKRNFYKEHLQNEILNWLHHVPMFYSLDFTTKDIKDNVVFNLAEKINSLVSIAHEPCYEMKVKMEIENCLSRLPMWLHGTKRDQMLFKDGLREKLWTKIRALNENFLGVRYEKAVEHFEHFVMNDDPMRKYEKEVFDWSQKLQLDPSKGVSKRNVVVQIMKRLTPLLKIPLNTTSYKLILKGEIIDILDAAPLALTSQRFRTIYLNKLAEDLANRLLTVQIKSQPSNTRTAGTNVSVYHQCSDHIMGIPLPKTLGNLKELITDRIGECLEKIKVCHRNDLMTEICSSFLDSKACLRTGDEVSIKDEICQYLRDTGRVSGERTQIVANMIIEQVKDIIQETRRSAATSFDSVIPELSSTVSIYRWGFRKKSDAPVTSTPKKSDKKEIPKLSPEEISYMDKVSNLIRTWMNTLPRQYNEDHNFKETIIRDLAGDLMDHFKVEQLAPDAFPDKDKYQKYVLYRWLFKFNFFEVENIAEDAKPHIADFLKKLKDIEVPNLTASQHGTRQAMEYIKHMEGERGWEEDYVPKGTDVLEDQISVWMNEQPSEIYSNKDKKKRDKAVHDLALNLQDHLRNKSPESEIDKDINSWLKKMVRYKEREHVGVLSQDLKERVINVPQDRTLQARHEERQRDIAAKIAAKKLMKAGPSDQVRQDVSNIGNIEGDPDRTIREFIPLYIERYYNIEDPLVFNAFAQLLKTELRTRDVYTRKEIYEYFEQSKIHEKFRPEKHKNRFDYIKIISNWLNTIPIERSFNTPNNKTRIEFVNDLAKNIEEIEEQRYHNPNAMEYNYLTASMILQTMHTYDLPILPEHKDNTPLMVEQLLQKLAEKRPISPRETPRSQTTSMGNDSLSQSLNVSDIKEQNLNDFINDYIRLNGRDIANDDLKLEIWTSNLYKEVNKMIKGGMDPATPNKAQLYDKFADVHTPTDEDVKRYGFNTKYREDIISWMRNLPLVLPNFELEEKRLKMISDLSEKMCETDALRRAYPNDKSADTKLETYIGDWISKLPLDKSQKIELPKITQQLMSKLDKVSNIMLPKSSDSVSRSSSSKSDKSKSMDKKDSKQSVSKRSSKNSGTSLLKSKKSPADTIVEAIEAWCNKLPIKDKDKEAVKTMKQDIARKLYQKTGELNLDPAIFNDDILYREMLGDEIDTQLENVPQNPELQKNREKLKESLLNTIMETNQIIKEKSKGENYRNKLESTLDASIPNPVQSTHVFDPGFELYKNNLANMFILDNFDHANDDVKAKYEKRIKQETDKYFESARNKNALPLAKDQIYNELYSALFKVPMPNETSVIDEVEQVKTRCEIDGWYETLPVEHTDNLIELLERDKILSTLAKRIHEIEKTNKKVDEQIIKETKTWLEKLSLTPGHQGYDTYAKQLLTILKSTAKERKYVPSDKTCKGKCRVENGSKDKKGSKNTTPPLQSKATHAKPCCMQATPMVHRKPGDMIVEIVDDWCNRLPLNSSEEENKVIRDNISTRIIIQISELNMDPDIFNDDVVYTELLDEELEDIMSNLPVNSDFQNSKMERKYQLITKIMSIKPLIKEEKARHEYKQELDSTVASIIKEPRDSSADKLARFNQLKEEIVENFVQFNYNKNDEEGRKLYKQQVHDAIVKYCIDVRESCADEEVDPLIQRNQLLCELEKIPVPQTALSEEVAEIKMKKEVEQLLRQQSVPEGETTNKIKKHLARRLCDIEKSGYTPPNEKKMKLDIIRCFKKLNKGISSKDVDDFINKLKNNEAERKVPPLTCSETAQLNCQRPTDLTGAIYFTQDHVLTIRNQDDAKTPQKHISSQIPSQNDTGEQWKSLPETLNRMQDSSNQTPLRSEAQNQSRFPRATPQFDQSIAEPMNYSDFEAGNFLNSTMAPPNNYTQTPYQAPGQAAPQLDQSVPEPLSIRNQDGYKTPQRHITSQTPVQNNTGEQWVSLPETLNPMRNSGYPTPSYPGTENQSRYQPATPQFDQNMVEPKNYSDFEAGSFLSSSKASPNYYGHTPNQVPGQFNMSNSQPGPGVGQRFPNQYYQSPQQPQQGARESLSGRVHSPPSFGNVGTPRQVAPSPAGAPSPSNAVSPDDATPESLFQAPVFRPVPYQRPLPVPILEGSPVQGPSPSQHDPRVPMAGSINPLTVIPHCLAMPGRRRLQCYRGEDSEICVCERCTGKNCRGIPLCVLAMQKYFEDCFGFPICMHFPDCCR